MPQSSEQAHLAVAHHELCTSLTVLRLAVELVRIRLRDEPPTPTTIAVHVHLADADQALERLDRVASAIRARHEDATDGEGPPLGSESPSRRKGSSDGGPS